MTSNVPPRAQPVAATEWLAADARRRDRHLRLTIAARDAFSDPAFQRDLADLKMRCRLAPRVIRPAKLCDTAFDARHERDEGWALEPISNVFA